jgi:hypothetical protein
MLYENISEPFSFPIWKQQTNNIQLNAKDTLHFLVSYNP